jgi:drug/metabolite transporter (DMT)-like permease
MDAPAPAPANRTLLLLSLLAVYLVWGSTYFGMRVALGGFPPLLMAALRFLLAGTLMLGALKVRGHALPTPRQWRNCALVGTLLLAMGNGGVAVAEQWVASGLAAVMIASVPLWSAVFAGLLGSWPSWRERVGLGIGAAGVVLLNLGGDLRGQPLGAVVLLGAAASWALGSVWSKRLDLPSGLMASAAQMLCGGAVLLTVALVRGDRPSAHVPTSALAAVLYLALFGSVLAYSAYGYLLRHASPALATSYAFVNPAIAVLLGVALGGEHPGPIAIAAMGVIMLGVALVVVRRRPAPSVGEREPVQVIDQRR